MLRRKTPAAPNAFAAVGILRSLDPTVDLPHAPDHSEDSMTEASFREEKKEKRGFWERAGVRDRDRDKDKDKDKERERERDRERARERDRREDESHHADLTRMIGWLTATASEDWSLVLEVCERASSTEANAKEAAKALRREFKYAEPSAQLSAARLWAIMLRNCSELFITQCASRKFLDTLEGVVQSSRTSPVVRERLLEVLAAAAYASKEGTKEEAFRTCWRKVKPTDKPDEGVPFDTGDAMFYPPTPRYPPPLNAQAAAEQPHTPSQRPALPHKSKTSSRHRVIPPEEDMRRLFQECKVGKGNAALLSESLAFAKPEDLRQKEIIREFYARCRASQELISAQIPWAFTGAERSRQDAHRNGEQRGPVRPSMESNRTRTDSQISRTTSEDGQLTQEEQLLAALLAANEDLMEALRQYDDLERVGMEREAEERSRKETRMDRNQLRYEDLDRSLGDASHANLAAASSSRSPSPSSPSYSPAPSFVVTPVPQPNSHSHSHPLPPIPTHAQTNHAPPHTLPLAAQGSIQSLAPPPHAPMGPRSPVHNAMPRSRTPSPDQSSTRHNYGSRSSLESNPGVLARDVSRLRLHDSDAVDERGTPLRPSAKALGKRKVVDLAPDPFDPDDMFHDHTDESQRPSDESDSDDGSRHRHHPWHHQVHYVYDAAAERTQQRIKEGRLASAALVGSVH